MKKLLQLSTTLIVISIMFSSCDSSFSIVKRHYNKGYYIDYTRSNKDITSNINNEIPQPVTGIQRNITKEPVKQKRALSVSAQSMNEHDQIATGNSEKKLPRVKLQQILGQNPFNKIAAPLNLSSKNNKNSFESPAPNAITDDDRGARALSLLWIVILVLLILWLIGVLAGDFGIGPLINLLLVVALILLILWLLRVI